MDTAIHRKRPFGVRRALVIFVALSLCILASLFVFQWTCCSLILDDLVPLGSDVHFPVPPDCVVLNAPPPVATLAAIEKERLYEQLESGQVTMCRTQQTTSSLSEELNRSPQWLPSYVPGRWQYRRYVAIPAAVETPTGTLVVVELCRKRRWLYYKQICGDPEKYVVWR
jgi:hypothetical protein